MKRKIITTAALAILISLTGCGGSSSSANQQTNTPTVTGQFIDSAVAGLNYECSSGTKGVTDLSGTFTCLQGDTIDFNINGFQIGSSIIGEKITPLTLYPNNLEVVKNIAQLLQTLDSDNNPDNGITLDSEDNAVKALSNSVDVKFDQVDFDSAIATYIGKILVDEATALVHLEKNVDLGSENNTTKTVPNAGFSYGKIDTLAKPELIVDLYNETGYDMEYTAKGYHISLTKRDGLVSYDKDNNILWTYNSADADNFKEIITIIDNKVLVKSVSGFSFPKTVGLHYIDVDTGKFIANIPVANKNIPQDFYTLKFNNNFTAYLEKGYGAGVYDFSGNQLAYFDVISDIKISNTHIAGSTETTVSLYDINGTKLWDKDINECRKIYLADDYVLCAAPTSITTLAISNGDVLNTTYVSEAAYLSYMGVSNTTIAYEYRNKYIGLDADTLKVKYTVASNGHLARSNDKSVLYSSTVDDTLQANSFETGEVLWIQNEILTSRGNLTFKRDATILLNDGATSNKVFGSEL